MVANTVSPEEIYVLQETREVVCKEKTKNPVEIYRVLSACVTWTMLDSTSYFFFTFETELG